MLGRIAAVAVVLLSVTGAAYAYPTYFVQAYTNGVCAAQPAVAYPPHGAPVQDKCVQVASPGAPAVAPALHISLNLHSPTTVCRAGPSRLR
jgi:hypothetical protein